MHRFAHTLLAKEQVRQAGVAPGEEEGLRQRLRQMEAHRSSVQRCGLVRIALVGDEGAASGVQDGLRSVQTQLHAILADEEAFAAMEAGGQSRKSPISSSFAR